MTISALNGGTAWPMPQSTRPQAGQKSASLEAGEAKNAAAEDAGAAQEFLSYMKKTPAQRMQEAWLAKQGLTKAQFDALMPEEKQALLKKMRTEIEEQLKQEATANANRTPLNLLA